jgi:hypothetical protein
VFSSAVAREARRVKYAPARRECENVTDSVGFQITLTISIQSPYLRLRT